MTVLSDEEVDAELSLSLIGYDATEKWPEWSNASMREAYRAGRDDALASRMIQTQAALGALPLAALVADSQGRAYRRSILFRKLDWQRNADGGWGAPMLPVTVLHIEPHMEADQ